MSDLDLFLQVWIGIPIFMVVVSAYLVFAPFYDAPLQSFYCLLFVSAGIPFYLVFVRYKVVPLSFFRFVGEPLLIFFCILNFLIVRQTGMSCSLFFPCFLGLSFEDLSKRVLLPSIRLQFCC